MTAENRPEQDRWYLFGVSFLALFIELLLIRWLGTEIRIFSYFRNLTLISCFLGLGIGFSLKKYRLNFLFTLFLIALLVILVHPAAQIHGLGLQQISNWLVLPEYNVWNLPSTTTLAKLVAAYGMIALVVVILAGVFLPFGQCLGEIFRASGNRLHSYSINLIGSLVGIWAFALLSYLQTPPWMWFLPGAGGVIGLIRPRSRKTILALAALIPIVGLSMVSSPPPAQTYWSPYQKLELSPRMDRGSGVPVPFLRIYINSALYMTIIDLSPAQFERYPAVFKKEDAPYYPYDFPYRFQPRPAKVLMVGAGAGNDAAAALRNGAGEVDAVEIDPRIARLGQEFHPEKPYSDPRTRLYIDDARSFFKKTRRRYDLIIFGLLDSHTLTSNFTNINLDSYVYTLESLKEAKSLLAPGGIICLSFFVEQNHAWIGAKLYALVKEVFQEPPLIVRNYRANIQGTGGTLYICGDLASVKRRLTQDPELSRRVSGWIVDTSSLENMIRTERLRAPTDDWPYLYLKDRHIPSLYYILAALLLLMTFLALRFLFAEGRIGPSHFLFLGAGFMLVEVHSISKAALLFGSTWMVNAVIISAILSMALAANQVVQSFRLERMGGWYAGLFFSLLLSYFLPVDSLLVGNYLTRGLLAGAFYSLPLFFAGVIFARSLERVAGVEAAFTANMLGATLGGMLESASYWFGLKFVVLIAVLLYAASAVALKAMPLQGKAGATETPGE